MMSSSPHPLSTTILEHGTGAKSEVEYKSREKSEMECKSGEKSKMEHGAKTKSELVEYQAKILDLETKMIDNFMDAKRNSNPLTEFPTQEKVVVLVKNELNRRKLGGDESELDDYDQRVGYHFSSPATRNKNRCPLRVTFLAALLADKNIEGLGEIINGVSLVENKDSKSSTSLENKDSKSSASLVESKDSKSSISLAETKDSKSSISLENEDSKSSTSLVENKDSKSSQRLSINFARCVVPASSVLKQFVDNMTTIELYNKAGGECGLVKAWTHGLHTSCVECKGKKQVWTIFNICGNCQAKYLNEITTVGELPRLFWAGVTKTNWMDVYNVLMTRPSQSPYILTSDSEKASIGIVGVDDFITRIIQRELVLQYVLLRCGLHSRVFLKRSVGDYHLQWDVLYGHGYPSFKGIAYYFLLRNFFNYLMKEAIDSDRRMQAARMARVIKIATENDLTGMPIVLAHLVALYYVDVK